MFGVPGMARGGLEESLATEFCQRGRVVHANLVKKRNSLIGRKTAPSPLTSLSLTNMSTVDRLVLLSRARNGCKGVYYTNSKSNLVDGMRGACYLVIFG